MIAADVFVHHYGGRRFRGQRGRCRAAYGGKPTEVSWEVVRVEGGATPVLERARVRRGKRESRKRGHRCPLAPTGRGCPKGG